MTERKLKPHIRFKGFENNWKKVKMSQLVDERSENVVPDNQYPLMAFIAEKGVSDKGEKYNRDFLVKSEKKKYKKTEYGDLIYSSNNLEVGSIGINNYGNATISPVYSIFKVNKLMTYTFLGYLVQRKSFINNMIKYRQGVTYGQWKIHESDFLRLQEIIPNSKEQQKIGGLFSKLDRLLDLQQQKLDQLELLKKALLQKLFPKQDAKIPELRFKGFEDEWKTNALQEISKIVGGGTPDTNKADYWNGDINWYSPTEIGKKPFAYSSNKKISKIGLKKSSAKLLPANKTVLFTSRAGIGDMAILKTPAATNQGFQSLELKDNVYPYFVYSYGFEIKRKAKKLASGSTFLEISNKDMKRITLEFPNVKEQQKIGNLLSKIDRLIELENKKFSNLKLVKKSLLQNMFVE